MFNSICQAEKQRKFRPFVYEYFIRIYVNILYLSIWIFYTYVAYFSCLHSLYSCSATHNAYILLSLPSNILCCSSQGRNIINVISHVTISAGFHFSCSFLENKWTESISFFPICTTIAIEIEFFWIGCERRGNSHEDKEARNPSLHAFYFCH